MAAQFHFSKRAFTDRFAEDVLANLAFVWGQFDVIPFFICLEPDLVRVTNRLVDVLVGPSSASHRPHLVVRGGKGMRGDDCLATIQKVGEGSRRVLSTRQICR